MKSIRIVFDDCPPQRRFDLFASLVEWLIAVAGMFGLVAALFVYDDDGEFNDDNGVFDDLDDLDDLEDCDETLQ